MERALSDYEKIKRAEAIYNRRKLNSIGGTRVSGAISQETEAKREASSVKKLVLQICICLVLYFIMYLIQNSNYIFSEEFINKTKEILSYDVDFSKYISQFVDEIKAGAKWMGIVFWEEETQESKGTENKENEPQSDGQNGEASVGESSDSESSLDGTAVEGEARNFE